MKNLLRLHILALALQKLAGQRSDVDDFTFERVVDMGGDAVVETSAEKQVVLSFVVDLSSDSANWIRLRFDTNKTYLQPGSGTGFGRDLAGDVLRITSVDRNVQYLNNSTLSEWQFHSALFNGAKVTVDLLSSDSRNRPRVFIDRVFGGRSVPGGSRLLSLCSHGKDNRAPSDDPRVGRLMPSGCTAFIIDDDVGCQLTAGHCVAAPNTRMLVQVLQINVPRSLESRIRPPGPLSNVQHPHPMYQFAIDRASVRARFRRDLDFAYLGTFRNPNTGLTAREAGDMNGFATVREGRFGDNRIATGLFVGVIGYGSVNSRGRPEYGQIQQSARGLIIGIRGDYELLYRADTMRGNSGSVVLDDSGAAIAIHTKGGCSSSWQTGNSGILLSHPSIKKALAQPQGVCNRTID